MNNTIQGNLLFMYTETALHAGSGSTVSVIDLPIQRERTTNFPNIQGSGIKGALRAEMMSQVGDNNTFKEQLLNAFGNETNADKDNLHAGSVAFGEARVVLFPVRSLLGVFAHVTCPFVLGRLARDMKYAGLDTRNFPANVSVEGDNCLVSTNTSVNTGSHVVLEEYAFNPTANENVDQLADWLRSNALPIGEEYDYWRNRLRGHLVILPDDAFRDFVSNSTQITTHIKIDNGTKTVAQGALWTKESLPTDTLMVSTVIARQSRRQGHEDSAEDVMNFISRSIGDRVQLAGDETTGNGIVALKWHN